MKKTIAVLLILTVLLTMGCGSSGSSAGSDRDTAAELGVEASTKSAAQAAASQKDKTGTGSTAPAEVSAAATEAAAAEETEAAAEAVTAETTEPEEAAETAQAGTTADASAEKEDGARAEPSPEQKEETPEAEPEADEDENEYVPEGFVPYGTYVLVYDSGYEVKSRYSEAGLTFYMESEEFLFILDKNLPNFPKKIAHILFNTTAPMDPSEAGDETFPYDEGYVMYINLDDGSYYEVYKSQLDLKGRIFVRDLYESFREKWEGTF